MTRVMGRCQSQVNLRECDMHPSIGTGISVKIYIWTFMTVVGWQLISHETRICICPIFLVRIQHPEFVWIAVVLIDLYWGVVILDQPSLIILPCYEGCVINESSFSK